MQSRLGELGLQSIDVGGAGDCLFRSVSELYGNSNHNMQIHTAGVQFMRDNPERFIESNTENSWLRYLNNMCIQSLVPLGPGKFHVVVLVIHAASLYYLTHITNVWGCMEILPIHCGAGSVKVNYYRCMRKL